MYDYDSIIGMNISSALDKLRQNLPHIKFEHLPEGSITTCEYVDGRVRVWYSTDTSCVTDITHG